MKRFSVLVIVALVATTVAMPLSGETPVGSLAETRLVGKNVQTLYVEDSTVLAGVEGDAGIYRSTDSGTSWPVDGYGKGLNPADVLAIVRRGNDLLAGTWGGGVFNRSNADPAWSALNDGMHPDYQHIRALVVDPQSYVVYAADPLHVVYRLQPGSTTWETMPTDTLPPVSEGQIRCLFVDNQGYLYAGLSDQGVWKYDAGTWAEVPGLSGMSPRALDYGPDGALWAATNGGVYSLGGGRWELKRDTDEWSVLTLKRSAANELYIGTAKGRVYRYDADSTPSWEPLSLGIPAGTRVRCLAYGTGNSRRLFAGTSDGLYYDAISAPPTQTPVATRTPTSTPTHTPVPTIPTPTPTPTRIPESEIRLTLANEPAWSHLVEEGDIITYTIHYENPGIEILTGVAVECPIPEEYVEYVGSESGERLSNPDRIRWWIGDVGRKPRSNEHHDKSQGDLLFQVRVRLSSPTPEPTSTPTHTPPPNAPSNLSAMGVSETQINLLWTDNSNEEDGFHVYRDGSLHGAVGANVPFYQDGGLECGQTFMYTVTAYSELWESAPSNVARGSTYDCSWLMNAASSGMQIVSKGAKAEWWLQGAPGAAFSNPVYNWIETLPTAYLPCIMKRG